MSDTVRAATDRLIELSHQAQDPLSHLPTQKLLFFVEGWHLALTDAPLFDEDFEAWALGPLLPSVNRRLRLFGSAPIPRHVIDTKPERVLSDSALSIIDKVYNYYTQNNPGQLVGLTHLPGTPWAELRLERGTPQGEHLHEPIGVERTKAWFKSVWEEAITPSTRTMREVSYAEMDWWTGQTA